jgi:hypothetical protein
VHSIHTDCIQTTYRLHTYRLHTIHTGADSTATPHLTPHLTPSTSCTTVAAVATVATVATLCTQHTINTASLRTLANYAEALITWKEARRSRSSGGDSSSGGGGDSSSGGGDGNGLHPEDEGQGQGGEEWAGEEGGDSALDGSFVELSDEELQLQQEATGGWAPSAASVFSGLLVQQVSLVGS